MSKFVNFKHPYEINPKYKKKAAYFCMEYAVDQALKTYSGGLGFLAGSHMRAAFQLRQNLVGIGVLWKYGYYDQIRAADNNMDVRFIEKVYNFLEDTGIEYFIEIHNHDIKVKVYYLNPETFGTAPIFFLTTDLPENDYLAQTTSYRLYDANTSAKIAQYILLGIGGMRLLEIIGFDADIHHFNEAHPLPGAFYLYNKNKDLEKVKKQLVFTTHTPVASGNEIHNVLHLDSMSYFSGLTLHEVKEITGFEGNELNLTLSMLRMSKLANAVSAKHGEVSRAMWGDHANICPIISVTNAQDEVYWMDKEMRQAVKDQNIKKIKARKKEFKQVLLAEVADQTGKLFDPDALTIVWARRFAPYKRAELLTHDLERFKRIINNSDKPVQFIWAGKPYPADYGAIAVFNHLIDFSKKHNNCAVMVGYELRLSKVLKQGSDVWLNNPRIGKEASGTSGMTAAMNGSINFSIPDGWVPEFARHNWNCFASPPADEHQPEHIQDAHDLKHLMDMLEHEVIPKYYDDPEGWGQMMLNSMTSILPYFDAKRMADEYYTKLYK